MSRSKNRRNAVTETANMGRRAAIYNETYLCCSSSLVPRRVRRGEEIGESGERRGEERREESGECGGERSWRGSRRIWISFRRHVRISTWQLVEALSGKGPLNPSQAPAEETVIRVDHDWSRPYP